MVKFSRKINFGKDEKGRGRGKEEEKEVREGKEEGKERRKGEEERERRREDISELPLYKVHLILPSIMKIRGTLFWASRRREVMFSIPQPHPAVFCLCIEIVQGVLSASMLPTYL